MKKIITLSLLLIPLLVFADETVTINGVEELQWKDFAPPAYINVSEPKGLGKFNDTASYWYKRKVEFESGIEKCRAIEATDEKVNCYQQLKVKQYQKNSDYNARLEAMERSRMGAEGFYDSTTNNKLPINGYLNNFSRFQPNELH